MDCDEELAGVVGLGKSAPHMTRKKNREQEENKANTMKGIRAAEMARG